MPLPRSLTRDARSLSSAKRSRPQPPPTHLASSTSASSVSSLFAPQTQEQSSHLQTYADAFRQESARIVAAVQVPLRSLVSVRVATSSHDMLAVRSRDGCSRTIIDVTGGCVYHAGSAAATVTSSGNLVLTLRFADPHRQHRREGVWRILRRNAIDTKRIAPALDAIALVLAHARLLGFDAELRADFWAALLDSSILATSAPDAVRAWVESVGADGHRYRYRHEGRASSLSASASLSSSLSHSLLASPAPPPPRVVLDFGHPRAKLDRRWFDALYKFLTEPQHALALSRQFPSAHCCRGKRTPAKIFFGLSFTDAALSTAALARIQRLLDCVAPGCSRDYGIDMLDLSRNTMAADQLAVVTAIVKRNRLYQIADIRLDEVIASPLARTDSASVQDLLAAALVEMHTPAARYVGYAGNCSFDGSRACSSASVTSDMSLSSCSPPCSSSSIAYCYHYGSSVNSVRSTRCDNRVSSASSASRAASSRSICSTHHGDGGTHQASTSKYHALARSIATPVLPPPPPTLPLPTLPRISLTSNPLGVEHIVSVCSALRYGCALGELSLSSMLRLVGPRDRALCWRWLAFGIFYPRSVRFADRFALRRIELASADISSSDMDAFANALYNPVAELRRPGEPEDREAIDAVLVAVVQRGATIYSLPDALSRPLATLAYAQEMEILHSRTDSGWVCAVVAGVGLGWLEVSHVVSVECDLVGASRSGGSSSASGCRSRVDSGSSSGNGTSCSVSRGTNESESASNATTKTAIMNKHKSGRDGYVDSDMTAARFELVVRCTSRASRVLSKEALTFIETVGRQLRALAVRDSAGLSIQNIAYHCKHLTHLDLEGCDLADADAFRDLLGCLSGHFGRRLVALNLNRTGVTNDDVAALGKILGNPRKLPRLRELRIFKARVNHIGLESLHAALRRNRTLALVELEEPGTDFFEEWIRAARVRIDVDCHNAPVRGVPLRLAQKLALLSAVLGVQSRVERRDVSSCHGSQSCRDDRSYHDGRCGSDACSHRDSRDGTWSLKQGLRLRPSLKRDLAWHAPRVFDTIFAFAEEPVRRKIVWTKPVSRVCWYE